MGLGGGLVFISTVPSISLSSSEWSVSGTTKENSEIAQHAPRGFDRQRPTCKGGPVFANGPAATQPRPKFDWAAVRQPCHHRQGWSRLPFASTSPLGPSREQGQLVGRLPALSSFQFSPVWLASIESSWATVGHLFPGYHQHTAESTT